MEIKFNVGQKIYYIRNTTILEGVILQINVDKRGIIYDLDDGYYNSVEDYKSNTRLKENEIFLNRADAENEQRAQLMHEIEDNVIYLNKRLIDAGINAKVVIENV